MSLEREECDEVPLWRSVREGLHEKKNAIAILQ